MCVYMYIYRRAKAMYIYRYIYIGGLIHPVYVSKSCNLQLMDSLSMFFLWFAHYSWLLENIMTVIHFYAQVHS